MRLKLFWAGILVILTCPVTAGNAAMPEGPDDNEQKAIALVDRMEEIYRGDSSRAKMTMTIETPEYQRSLTLAAESMGTEDSLIRVLSPAKDRGITTLKLDKEMWNYFPKINKVIKVPPSMMMGSWMGSDFTNDDLVQETKLTDEYRLTLNEDADSYNITLVPRAQTVTVWGRIDYIIDKQKLIPLGQNFYDDKGEMVRKLTFSDPKQFGKLLLPSKLEMVPLNKEGHRTVVKYDELVFDPKDVTKDDFTLRNLKSRF
ncbi:MAG: outer membrane lipoprotein-sorting protein [Pseudomonadales bacterium]|nr:outer membrane lipoprotein-sorting protein [Pseudomonadales bacterium]